MYNNTITYYSFFKLCWQDISPKKRDGSVGVPKHILTSFSYIGAAVSILALIVTIVTYLSEK